MVRKTSILGFVTIIGLGVLLLATNPEHLPPAIFIGFFILLYGFCYSFLALIGMAFNKLGVIQWSTKRISRTAFAVASLPVFLLVLQSIGQLTLKDVLLTSGLFILLYLYFGRVFAQPTN